MDRCAVGGVRDPLVAGLEPSVDCPSAATQYVEVRKLINNKIIIKKVILTMAILGSTSLASAQTNYSVLRAVHPDDFKRYDTEQLRSHFIMEKVMEQDKINLTYSLYDRIIYGGVIPVAGLVALETIDALKADYFLERRELGIINIGGEGIVTVDGQAYELRFKDALYVGRGHRSVTFQSKDAAQPAKFYLNSSPAHHAYKTQLVTIDGRAGSNKANRMKAGKLEDTNDPLINHLHTHNVQVPEGNAICHFMGDPRETRHVWLHNEQAVMSPEWSIHAAAGTSNYMFIWGMGGENLDYNDMDKVTYLEMR